MRDRLIVFALAASIGGCTATFHGDDGLEYHTMSNLWSPNATVVKLPDGSYHVLGGSSTIGQIAGPAAVAYAGHEVGQGLEESGDTINLGAAGGGGSTGPDINGDGKVDVLDLRIVYENWTP